MCLSIPIPIYYFLIQPFTMRARYSLLALSMAQNALCWGNLGHGTVAYIAQKYLSQESASYLNQILVDEQGQQIDFFDAAIWPDEVRHSRPYSADWHYIGNSLLNHSSLSSTDPHFLDAQDQPPQVCQVSYPQGCTNSEHKNGCIINAITNQTSLFLDPNTDATTRQEALKYIIHFVGDVHQPLHVEDAYRGANEITPVCFAHACANNNLHSVWDKYIPDKITGTKNSAHHDEELESAQRWADKLYRANAASDGQDPLACGNVQDPSACSLQWAGEANTYVCSYAMKESVEWYKSNDLSLDYYEGAVPIVEYLIGRAGERLGVYLNALVQAAGGQQQEKKVELK